MIIFCIAADFYVFKEKLTRIFQLNFIRFTIEGKFNFCNIMICISTTNNYILFVVYLNNAITKSSIVRVRHPIELHSLKQSSPQMDYNQIIARCCQIYIFLFFKTDSYDIASFRGKFSIDDSLNFHNIHTAFY